MKVTVEHLGVKASGNSLAEAKRNAANLAAKVLRTAPRVYAHRGHAVMVSATLDGGGQYTLTGPDSEGLISLCCGCDSYEAAIESGIRHMLDNARDRWDHTVPEWAPENLRNSLPAQWFRDDVFYECYDCARAAGMSDAEAHEWASRNDFGFRDIGDSPDAIRAAIREAFSGKSKKLPGTEHSKKRAPSYAPGI